MKNLKPVLLFEKEVNKLMRPVKNRVIRATGKQGAQRVRVVRAWPTVRTQASQVSW